MIVPWRLAKLVLHIDDEMRHVVVVDPGDRGAGVHPEHRRREIEVVDADLVGSEHDRLPRRLGLQHRIVRRGDKIPRPSGERCIHHGERAAPGYERHVGDAKDALQLNWIDFHGSGARCGSGSGLRKCRGHCGMKRDVAFELLHDLVIVPIEDGDRPEALQQPQCLF